MGLLGALLLWRGGANHPTVPLTLGKGHLTVGACSTPGKAESGAIASFALQWSTSESKVGVGETARV